MRADALSIAVADGWHDARRFWWLILGAFVHAIVSCLLLGLSLQQAGEAQAVADHLQRWDQEGAASLRSLYLAGTVHPETGASPEDGAVPSLDGLEETAAPGAPVQEDGGHAAMLALLADPEQTAYTMDPYGDRFGDDLPGAVLVTEDFMVAAGLKETMAPTGQTPQRGADGSPAPYAVLGSASNAKDPYALSVDGVMPPTTRVRFQDTMIPVVARLAPGSTALDPMMGSVSLDDAVLVVVPPPMLTSLYDTDALDALLLRAVALGPDAHARLDQAARSLESEALLVATVPLSADSSPLLQELSGQARTLVVLFGAAVLGAVVSLFGALGILARGLAPTWRIAAMVGAAPWQAAVRIAVPVVLAWVLPAAVGLAAGAAVLPGQPSTGLMAGALIVVLVVGVAACLSSWRALAATFGHRRRRRNRPMMEESHEPA